MAAALVKLNAALAAPTYVGPSPAVAIAVVKAASLVALLAP